jgi:hypothetical protein
VQDNICFGGQGTYYGTLWHGGDHNTFTNNIFDLDGDNTQILGLYQDMDGLPGPNYGMANNVFSNNIVLTNSNAGLWETCCGYTIQYPSFSNNLYWTSLQNVAPFVDSTATIADPLLANPSNPGSDNYALQPTSPAITNLGFQPIDTSQNGPIPACP